MTKELIEEAKDTYPAEIKTDAHARILAELCQKFETRPADRKITPMLRFNKRTQREEVSFHVGIDLCRQRAESSGCYAGSSKPIFTGEPKKPGWVCEVTIGKLVGGEVRPFVAEAEWSEYASLTSPIWSSKPRIMLAKCAEMLALRKAFPSLLSGVYDPSEFDKDKPATTGEALQEGQPPKAEYGKRGETNAAVGHIEGLFRELCELIPSEKANEKWAFLFGPKGEDGRWSYAWTNDLKALREDYRQAKELVTKTRLIVEIVNMQAEAMELANGDADIDVGPAFFEDPGSPEGWPLAELEDRHQEIKSVLDGCVE